jgi:hypothetical protein
VTAATGTPGCAGAGGDNPTSFIPSPPPATAECARRLQPHASSANAPAPSLLAELLLSVRRHRSSPPRTPSTAHRQMAGCGEGRFPPVHVRGWDACSNITPLESELCDVYVLGLLQLSGEAVADFWPPSGLAWVRAGGRVPPRSEA